MNLLRIFLLCTALAWGPGAAVAAPASGDFISERGYLEDDTGQLTVEQVRDRPFTAFNGPLAHGNRNTVIWLRLQVPAQPAAHRALVLLLQPASVGDLRVYLPQPQGGWNEILSGSRRAYAERPRPDLNFAIPVETSTTEPRVIYVRVSTSTAVIQASLLTPEAARDFDTELHVGVGLYLGLALMIMMLSIIMWWSTRDALWLSAALFDLATMVQVSIPLGLFAKYIAPNSADLIPTLHALSSSVHLTVICMFSSFFVQALQAPRWVVWGYRWVLLALPVWIWMCAEGLLAETQRLVNLGVLVVTLWAIMPILTVRTPDLLLRWMYRFFSVILVAYLLYWVLPILRIGAANSLTLYPTLPSNLFTMIMMTMMLSRRAYMTARAAQRLEMEKLEAENRLRMEQQHHAETSGMLGMIMHEMKNPLASIRVASELLSSGRVRTPEDQDKRFRNIQDAVDGIDTVLQRVIDVDRLEQGALLEERQLEDVGELLRQWLQHHRQSARLQTDIAASLQGTLDARLMFLLLGNLLENALKYSPPASVVRVQAARDAEGLRIEVRNVVGRAGWPDPQRLFQKYYRSPTAQHGSGTGLGLYWVHKVSQMIGGAVNYRADGDDVVFTLSLPL